MYNQTFIQRPPSIDERSLTKSPGKIFPLIAVKLSCIKRSGPATFSDVPTSFFIVFNPFTIVTVTVT